MQGRDGAALPTETELADIVSDVFEGLEADAEVHRGPTRDATRRSRGGFYVRAFCAGIWRAELLSPACVCASGIPHSKPVPHRGAATPLDLAAPHPDVAFFTSPQEANALPHGVRDGLRSALEVQSLSAVRLVSSWRCRVILRCCHGFTRGALPLGLVRPAGSRDALRS